MKCIELFNSAASIARKIKSLEANGQVIYFLFFECGKASIDLKGIEFDRWRINRLIIELTNYPVSGPGSVCGVRQKG